jgi:N-acetylglucosamine kinase-like BadF-type ATPase
VEGHESPPRLAASFAGDVAGAAASGDEVAVELLRQAAMLLAATVRAASPMSSGGSVRFALMGGLLGLGPMLTGPLLEALRGSAPWLELVPAAGTALDGARLLALDASTLHERHLIRVTALDAVRR